MESAPIVERGEMMRCEMPSEMREEMMSGVRGWGTAVNVLDAEGVGMCNSMNEADGKARQK